MTQIVQGAATICKCENKAVGGNEDEGAGDSDNTGELLHQSGQLPKDSLLSEKHKPCWY